MQVQRWLSARLPSVRGGAVPAQVPVQPLDPVRVMVEEMVEALVQVLVEVMVEATVEVMVAPVGAMLEAMAEVRWRQRRR